MALLRPERFLSRRPSVYLADTPLVYWVSVVGVGAGPSVSQGPLRWIVSTRIVGTFHCISSYLHCHTKKKPLRMYRVCMHAYTYRTLVREFVHCLVRGRVHCICAGRSGSPCLLVRHDNVEIVLHVQLEHYAESLTNVCMRKSLRNCGLLSEFEFHSCVLCFF